jgi:hypothetical protein
MIFEYKELGRLGRFANCNSDGFISSRISVESLEIPSRKTLEQFGVHFESLKGDGFHVEGAPGYWRCIRKLDRQDEWTRTLSVSIIRNPKKREPIYSGSSAKIKVKELLDNPDTPDDSPDSTDRTELYRLTNVKVAAGASWCIFWGTFFCSPFVILALGFAPQWVNILLVCTFVISSGGLVSWLMPDNLFPVVVMVAYAAVLVSVNVGGY